MKISRTKGGKGAPDVVTNIFFTDAEFEELQRRLPSKNEQWSIHYNPVVPGAAAYLDGTYTIRPSTSGPRAFRNGPNIQVRQSSARAAIEAKHHIDMFASTEVEKYEYTELFLLVYKPAVTRPARETKEHTRNRKPFTIEYRADADTGEDEPVDTIALPSLDDLSDAVRLINATKEKMGADLELHVTANGKLYIDVITRIGDDD